ncbi:MAG: hypothetical protein JW991_00320 [Candidatus Pacebacteria bacterium]|nr:hypothetical protein [Candidatus Paceibacterota bacterium]
MLEDLNDLPSKLRRHEITLEKDKGFDKKRERYHSFWQCRIPEENQATLEVYRLIKYDSILAIDEHGDIYNSVPHLYVIWNDKGGPFDPDLAWPRLKVNRIGMGFKTFRPIQKKRISFFPKPIPKISKNEVREYWKEREKKI